MTDWRDASPLAELLAAEVTAMTRRYRATEALARAALTEACDKSATLQSAIAQGMTADRLKGTRAFRDVVTAARKTLYYRLRQYHDPDANADPDRLEAQLTVGDPDDRASALRVVAATHVSARERLPTLDEFTAVCCRAAPDSRTVLDVGCGLHPLLAPLDGAFRSVARYVAVDRDAAAIDTVGAYARARADDRLLAIRWSLDDGWESLAARTGIARYDLALILKVAPVVARQSPPLLATLAQTPADRWVISGSAVAMTRKQSIVRRERAVLRRFLAVAGRPILDEAIVGDEIVLIA